MDVPRSEIEKALAEVARQEQGFAAQAAALEQQLATVRANMHAALGARQALEHLLRRGVAESAGDAAVERAGVTE